MLPKLIEAFILGAIGGAVPGPMLTAVFTEVLNSGFLRSLRVVMRAFLAEAGVAVLVLLVVFALRVPTAVFYVISILGAGYLIYLASQVWRINKIAGDNGEIFPLSKILLLTILNGGFWIFWLTICVPRAFALRQDAWGGQWLFMIAFELGWVIMTAGLAYIFSRFRSLLLKKNLVAIVFKIFALLLAFFAIKSIYGSIMYFNSRGVSSVVVPAPITSQLNIYCSNDKVDGLSRDNFGYYYYGAKINVLIEGCLKSLGNEYWTDGKKVFSIISGYNIFEQVDGADPNSFQELKNGFWRDKNSVYWVSKKIFDSDPDSFKILKDDYASDKKNVYYLQCVAQECPDAEYKAVVGADPKTFVVIGSNYAKDQNHVYNGDTIVEGADPSVFDLNSVESVKNSY